MIRAFLADLGAIIAIGLFVGAVLIWVQILSEVV